MWLCRVRAGDEGKRAKFDAPFATSFFRGGKFATFPQFTGKAQWAQLME